MLCMMTPSHSTDRRALITGSARRVGRVIAERLQSEGWSVAVHSRSIAAAQHTAHEIDAVVGLGGDLADPAACAALVDAAADALGGLDLVVCNASSFVRAHPENVTIEQWDHAMHVVTRAPLLVMQHALPRLRASHGSVVLISDRSAREQWPAFAAHAAATAALESLCRSCAAAWHPHVRVNAIQPGTIMPPDEWDDARLQQARAAGELTDIDHFLDALIALASSSHRSGEIVVL